MTAVEVLDPVGGATPELDPADYLAERYDGAADASRATHAYYRVKPLLPRAVQLALRRAYARRQARRPFPRWPVEPLLVDHLQRRLRATLAARGGEPLPFVWLWPDGRRFAVTVTHDVEGPAGIANVERLLEVERRHGIVSSWNFCAEWYRIPDGLFDRLRAAGCEIGLHGITHDDRLFRDRASFEAQLPAVRRYLRAWGAEGFRSPATHRNAAWMPELGAAYDSSFPDTDPFQPKPGGCCSIFPYFLGDLVELPITLPQDQVLWELLRAPTIRPWLEKLDWIAAHNGLATLLVHPDYALGPDRLALYDRLLARIAALEDAWLALPRDVAAWWRARATAGAAAPGAVLGVAEQEDGGVTLRVAS